MCVSPPLSLSLARALSRFHFLNLHSVTLRSRCSGRCSGGAVEEEKEKEEEVGGRGGGAEVKGFKKKISFVVVLRPVLPYELTVLMQFLSHNIIEITKMNYK